MLAGLADVLGEEAVEETVEYRHRPTHAIDPDTGQGDAHVQFAFSAHRAVVDVDVELGLVKVVALDTAQDVGKAINPDAVVGQIHGGSAQGMGLALMEEIVVTDGHVRNPSFTDYLIPTILDMPPMQVKVLEYADPHAPYGVRGVGSRRPSRRGPPSPPPSGPPAASRCAACRSARSTSPAPEPGNREITGRAPQFTPGSSARRRGGPRWAGQIRSHPEVTRAPSSCPPRRRRPRRRPPRRRGRPGRRPRRRPGPGCLVRADRDLRGRGRGRGDPGRDPRRPDAALHRLGTG
ncbi:molybdopterin cofactor-binding domain-containing protein [Blastococcus brunescens]|uniref:Molybdopterin cofactor-binding domain-containing protein n=1 Tax=Blastococcus brunescens TaxID=1564165 RepID=A0ABZ1B514_9ACTN|nr:molybdopterin cofactor-binding domain-containing protein [Blastococcus sp. BMG 8361]WRL65876.1 molybdopterin cofactor-binding domain-containing protein [Blastococcus sp. BMG 8361]